MKTVKRNRLQRTLMAAAVAACFAGQFAYANPVGPVVVSGQATFATSGRQLSVTNTPGAIINWQQFSIQANEATRFIQQSAASAVLNRVVGVDPSLILGTLQSNGRVFLINPNGILFGAGSQIDVAGLVASTLNLSNADFLAGRMRFTETPGAGSVVNQGAITTPSGGQVYLIAPNVVNTGIITSPQGEVILAAGRSAELVDAGTPNLRVEITAPDNEAVNVGQIVANSGKIGIYAGLIRNSGIIRADGVVVGANGQVLLKATKNATIDSGSVISANGAQGGNVTIQSGDTTLVSGTLEAKGSEGKGGVVQVLGDRVGLIAHANINVSGETGGGTVLIGGDYQGRNPDIQNARQSLVGANASINADAITSGNGGKVIVWADDTTQYYGSISVRGGAAGGNGGFVETSGKGWLDFQGQVDTRAPLGMSGTLLLDPTDITISTAASTPTSAFGGGTFSDTTTTPSNLNVTTLTNQLGLSNVIVTTASPLGGNGDITVNNAINYTSANSLTLNANRNITVVAGSGGINNTGAGAVTLTGAGAGSIAINESISTNGGNITLTSGTAGVNLAASKTVNAGAGLITINAGSGAANFTSGTLQTTNATASAISVINAAALTLGNVALTGGGTLSLSHSGAGTQTAGTLISGSGGLTKAGAGTLSLSTANTYTGATNINAGTLQVSVANSLPDGSAVTVAGGATFSLANVSDTIGSLAGAGTVTKTGAGAVTLTTGGDGTSTAFSGVIQNPTGTLAMTKQGAGTFTLTNTNTYTGATGVSGGTLTLSGASGSATGSAFTVNSGATLTLDNSGTNNNNRIAGALTMNGGEFVVLGNSAANTTEAVGALNLLTGYSTITLTPNAATNTRVTFASLARAAGAAALFRGTNLGANTVASQTANSSNIVFTAAPALTGGGGNSGTNTVSIVAGAVGDASSAGSGTDFVTYNPPTGSVNGLRPLLASEYQADGLAPGANVNYKLTANRSGDDTASINSLLLSGGVTYDYDSSGVNTLTVGGAALSGNVLSIGGSNVLSASGNPGGGVDFGTAEAKIFAVTDLTFQSDTPITGTGGLSKSGAGVLLENRSVPISGGLFVNSGTLRSGIASAFSTAQPLTVRAAGTFDLNGFNNSITTLTMESGAASGASVTTGAGTLTLGGNVTLNANGSGATGATLSGNLALGATRTFTVANGTASDDLTVSAIVSGAGFGITKLGTGQLTLSGANTYTGVTTITAGVLSANTLANGGVASSIGASTNAAANLVLGNATLRYTGGTAFTNRNFILSVSEPSSFIDVTNAAANLTLSGASTVTAGALTKLGSGTLTLAGTNGYTGLTTVRAGTLAAGVNNALSSGAVTVSGGTFDMGTFTDTVGAVTLTNGSITGSTGVLTGTSYAVQNGAISAILGGAAGLTKSTAGTVTLSGANTYTGSTTITAGVLSANSLANGGVASSIGASTNAAGHLLLGGGTLRYTGGTVATDRNYTLIAPIPGTTSSIDVTTAATNLTISGASTATASDLTKLGSGTLTLTGANLNSGVTTIRAGTLQLGNGGATGTLGTGAVTNIATLVFNRNNAYTVANNISSFGAVTQAGTGTTTLSGANTYSGATAVNAGTLVASNATALGNTAAGTTVASGATLEIANGIAIGAETLNLSGAGVGANGALVVTAGNGSLAGAVTLGASASIGGNGSLTLSGTVNDIAAGTSTLTQVGSGTLTFSNTVGATNALAAVTTSAGQTTAINGGSVRTTGAQTYGSAVNTSGAATLTSTGAGNITATNAANNFNGNLILSTSGSASIVDANALALGASAVGTLTAQTLAGDLTLNGAITATGAGDSIVLASAQDFVNNVGAGALIPGEGRWLVYSTSPAGSTENGLTGAAGSAMPRLYNRTFVGNPPASITEPGNHLLYSFQPALTVTPNNHSKVYGTIDPALTYVAAGYVTDDGVTDTAITAGLAGSFGRVAGESVAAGPYLINQGSFASGASYSIAFVSGNTLTITPAALSIQADDKSRTIGVPNPPFTASYSGFQFSETPAVLGGALSFTTPAIISSPAGAYAITPSGQISSNYAITYINGTLAVTTLAGGVTPTLPPQPFAGFPDGRTSVASACLWQREIWDRRDESLECRLDRYAQLQMAWPLKRGGGAMQATRN